MVTCEDGKPVAQAALELELRNGETTKIPFDFVEGAETLSQLAARTGRAGGILR